VTEQPTTPTLHVRDRGDVIAKLAGDAAAGDTRAWTELVNRLDDVPRRVAKSYHLQAADVDDVAQTTWLRALDHLGELRAHEAIAAWLVVIARREAMRILQRGTRETFTDSIVEPPEPDSASPDVVVIRQELADLVHGAVGRLSGRQQQLITSMLQSPTSSYEQLSSQLGMPVGAIGPTRSRALVKLRHDRELQGLTSPVTGLLAA
jgi:RNA polymerase sigma factor (sigma-70 family)